MTCCCPAEDKVLKTSFSATTPPAAWSGRGVLHLCLDAEMPLKAKSPKTRRFGDKFVFGETPSVLRGCDVPEDSA